MKVLAAATVPSVVDVRAPLTIAVDPESREWLESLKSSGARRDDAVARLHAILVRAARFEIARRRPGAAAPAR